MTIPVIVRCAAAVFLVLVSACSKKPESRDFFCEEPSQSRSYSQNIVRLLSSSICFQHRGREWCVPLGGEIDGYVDNGKNYGSPFITSEIYAAEKIGNEYVVSIFEKEELSPTEQVTKNLRDGKWNFSYNGNSFPVRLEGDQADEEAIKVFEYETVFSAKYKNFYKPDKYLEHSETRAVPTNAPDAETRLQKLRGHPKEIVFQKGSDRYEQVREKVNGKYLNSTYRFDENMLTIDLNDESLTAAGMSNAFTYHCQRWKKQRWFEFP